MLKLYRKIILLLCPIVIYFIAFLFFDEGDFSGIRTNLEISHNSKVISCDGDMVSQGAYSIMKYVYHLDSDNSYNVIFGDSKSNNIDVEELYRLSGDAYINLSWGGCTMEERISQFWYTIQKVNVDKVLFQLDYYMLNAGRQINRMEQVVDSVSEKIPIRYYLNFDNNVNMIRNVLKLIFSGSGHRENREDSSISRFDMYYPMIYDVCESYQLDEACLQKLVDVALYCNENDIKLIFFVPPLHRSIWKNVIEPLDLYDEIEQYKSILSEYAPIYDMENPSELSDWDEDWQDGHHFAGKVVEQMEKNILGLDNRYMKIWKKGDER